MFYFIRHGKTDYSQQNTKFYTGFGVHLSPLSQKGIQQIQAAAGDPRLKGADLILCSPYTRALQTAAILSRKLDAEIAVETDLHEWLADRRYRYTDDQTAETYYQEYMDNDGLYPAGTDPIWENAEMMRSRVLSVLEKYRRYPKVIVAGHGMMIQAVTGSRHPKNGEIIAFDW